jgi:hypothetical protein
MRCYKSVCSQLYNVGRVCWTIDFISLETLTGQDIVYCAAIAIAIYLRLEEQMMRVHVVRGE